MTRQDEDRLRLNISRAVERAALKAGHKEGAKMVIQIAILCIAVILGAVLIVDFQKRIMKIENEVHVMNQLVCDLSHRRPRKEK